MVCPPLTITREELDEGIAILDDALSVADEFCRASGRGRARRGITSSRAEPLADRARRRARPRPAGRRPCSPRTRSAAAASSSATATCVERSTRPARSGVPRRSRSGARPATPIATSVVPRRNGRPNESVTITATVDAGALADRVADPAGARVGVDRQQDERVRARPRSSGRRPAEAQTKPWRVSAITSALRERTMRAVSRRITSTRADRARPASSRARSDGSTSSSATTRPSAFETTFCATTTTSPSSSCACAGDQRAEVVALPDLGQALDRDDRDHGEAGDADAGVRLVAPVQVHDHRRQPLERARARERAGVERAAGDDLARRARARAAFASGSSPQTSASSSGGASSRFAAAIEWRPGDDRPAHDVLDPLGERARVRIGPDAVLRERRARSRPRAAASRRARPRSRARCRARRRPSPRARRGRRRGRRPRSSRRPLVRRARRRSPAHALASREPITTSSSPSATSRAASARPKLPVPPRIATLTPTRPRRRRARALREPARGARVVAHQRLRARRARTPPGKLGRRVRLVDHERVDQARVAAGDVRRATSRRRAARASGRPGP